MKSGCRQRRIFVALLAAVFAFCVFQPLIGETVKAFADDGYFCDEGYTGNSGSSYNDDYTITYDSYEPHYDYTVGTAPSIGNANNDLTNYCTALGGTNVVTYYDRYCPNLIPDFEPGMINGSSYQYFPDVGFAAIQNVMDTLYEKMGVNTVQPGATKNDFVNGLTEYVQEKGYSISYSSFYQSATTVNLSQVRRMKAENKVGIIFCNQFHFIYSINHRTSGTETLVVKRNFPMAHVMMVYGYMTIDYYRNGSVFLTETYLQVASCFGGGDRGYVKVGDFLNISDALLISIS